MHVPSRYLFTLCVGCSPLGVVPLDSATLETHSFSGEFTDGLQCADAVVDLTLTQGADGGLVGMYRVESSNPYVGGAAALYEVEGEVDLDGLLHLEQIGILEADENPGMQWCSGEMSLALVDDIAEPVLVGDWFAGDCGCGGRLAVQGFEDRGDTADF